MAKQKLGFLGMIGGIQQIIQLGQTVAAMKTPSAPEYAEPPLQNTDPMEGMANGEDLAQFEYKKGGFYLGRIHPDHGQNFQAGVNDDRHIFMVAGNSAGKGRSILIQNALRWKGGLFAIDPKGELASITAMRRGTEKNAQGTGTSVRKFIGQEVIILDPKNVVTGASRIYKKTYNPLSDIDTTSVLMHGQIRKLARGCIVPENGDNEHFSLTATIIMAGLIELIITAYPKQDRHFLTLDKILLKDWEDIVDELQGDKVPSSGHAIKAAGLISKLMDTNEIGSYHSTLTKNTEWLSDPHMKEQITGDGISIRKAVQSGASIYVVLPPDEIEDLKNWFRIITQTAFSAKVALGDKQQTQQTLFLIDEFALLGRFKEIAQGAGYLRGYNCKLVPVIQNLGQITDLYKDNWETFLGNAGAIIAFGLNDFKTEEYISKRTGKILAWETSFSTNAGMSAQGMSGGMSEGKTTSQAQRERNVRLPNEIHDQGARGTMRAFVIPADSRPFTIQRQNYDAIPASGLFDSPQFNIEWEQAYGGNI